MARVGQRYCEFKEKYIYMWTDIHICTVQADVYVYVFHLCVHMHTGYVNRTIFPV